MRQDMAKVIVERPRVHSYGKSKSRKKYDLEDLPQRESMWVQKGGTKDLNENLAPLKRFLISRRGKPWDQVFSEICENLSPRTAVQKHVLDHLHEMITLKTYLGVDGHIWGQDGGADFRVDSSTYPEFYVDPDGILRQPDKKARRSYRKEQEEQALHHRLDIGKLTQYHKINGIWYEVKLENYRLVSKKMTSPSGTHEHWYAQTANGLHPYLPGVICEALSPKHSAHALKHIYGREGVFATSKRQLSSKEMKRHGLKND